MSIIDAEKTGQALTAAADTSGRGRVSVSDAASDPELEARVRSCATIVKMLRLRAAEDPEQILLTFIGDDGEPDEPITARELDASARRVGALLQSLGAENQRVLLALQPGRQYCTAFWGCLYARAIAVPVYPPVSPTLAERVQAIAADSGATLVLTDRLVKSIGAGLATYAPKLSDLTWIEMEDLPAGSEARWVDPDARPEDLAFLQYTSGSTADPKGVLISHGNITANLRSLDRAGAEGAGVGAEHGLNRGYSWLPPFHDMGLTGMLLPVTGGHLVAVSPMLWIRRPERWIRDVSKWGSNVSGGPNFAYELVAERASLLEGEDIDLSQWKVAVSGAEHVRADTLDRFCQAYERYGFRRESFCPSYGMAEATVYISSANEPIAPLICHVDKDAFAHGEIVPRAEADDSTLDFVGCGKAGLDLSIVIVDTHTMTEAGPGKVGEIWARGPNIGHGYWGKPELTREAFGAMLSDARSDLSRGPWFRTGDHGFLWQEQLFIAGRINEVLQVGNRQFYPNDLELTAARACDVLVTRGGAAFTVNDAEGQRIVLVHEVSERSIKAADLGPTLRDALLREHGVTLSELVLIRRNSLMRTSSGKPRRLAMREAFLGGRVKIWSTWKHFAV